jgi:hypothetical protein
VSDIRADRHRHPPARHRAVQDQPHQQQRDLRRQVVRVTQHQLAGRARRRRQQDPAGDQRPDQPLPPGRPALGYQRDEQHHDGQVQRLERGDDPGVQPAVQPLKRRELGDLDGVERDVGQFPAVQQHVPVQHVPALLRDHRAVGTEPTRLACAR